MKQQEDFFEFSKSFSEIYNKEQKKLPYHINVIDVLGGINENAHSRIMGKLLQQISDGKFEILENFIRFIKEKSTYFNNINIKNPIITQEKERIDLWIRDDDYAIIIENKVNWAGDQNEQLARYIDKTKKESFSKEQIYVIYLSPTYEKEPEEQTWINEKGESYKEEFKNRYLKLSFREDVLSWLKEWILPNVRQKDKFLSSALEQYIDYLEGKFYLRTNYCNMNVELEKFIKDRFGLIENNPRKAIEILSEKEEEFNAVINQIQKLKKSFQKQIALSKFKQWKAQLKDDFSNLEIIDYNYNVDYINLGYQLTIDNQLYSVLIEYGLSENPPLYFGVGIHSASEKKHKPMAKELESLLISNNMNGDQWWYGRKSTSFENGYEEFGNFIKEIERLKNNSTSNFF
jgi:hypothetical protein